MPGAEVEKVMTGIKSPSLDERALKVEEKSTEEGIKSITHSVRVDISKLDNLMNIVGEVVMLKASIGGNCRNPKDQRWLCRNCQ